MTLLPRLALAGALIVGSGPAFAFDEKEKAEIGKIVREYLIQNPEVLYEAQQEWNRRQEARVAEKRGEALKTYLARIDEQKLHTVLGNPNGDVTLVEFFDYNCPYCRRAIKDIDQLIKDDPNLRIVLMELPVIYVFTHDSIGVGEDGPTHQPVEQLLSLRAIPGLQVIRPGDANEVVEAWRHIAALKHEPVALILSRQNLPTLDRIGTRRRAA